MISTVLLFSPERWSHISTVSQSTEATVSLGKDNRDALEHLQAP